MNGTILQGSPALTFYKFNIDSRLTEPGELFIAINAERNGHDFIPHALEKGALGAVISQPQTLSNKDIALIRVKDTLEALQKLAKEVLAEYPVRVVGITGSIGKTTTKEFSCSLLARNYNVLKSMGNFNNHLGLPLSLLNLTEKHEVAVLEMAMRAPGEIIDLTRIAPPDIAVITNICPVHLQFFESLEAIALAKREILDGIKKDGLAILNGDDSLVRKIVKDWKGQKLFFGFSSKDDIRALNIQKSGWKGMSFELGYGQRQEKIRFPFLYESYLYNLLAACAVSFGLSVPFDNVLTQIKILKPFSMRGDVIHLKGGITLIDDSYNSNPKGLEFILKGIADLPSKRKVAVLGDMLELGEKQTEYHILAGTQVAKWGYDILVTVGSLALHMAEGALASGMKGTQIHSYKNSDEAAEKIGSLIKKGDLVVVKGSRGMKTEKIVERLKLKGS